MERFKLFQKRTIGMLGEDYTVPLLIRYVVFRTPLLGIFIHKFCRSDYDRALHDHPWPFISIILWRGYIEHSANRAPRRYYPGAVLFRRATWRHRVEVINGKSAWTLIIVGPRLRKWGFWPDGKWCWWRTYNPWKAICEDEIIFTDNND